MKNIETGCEWIDVSVPLRNGMPQWPGDLNFQIEQINDLCKGNGYSLAHVRLSLHTGTHVDAPAHFVAGGKTIDQMPLDLMMGPAKIIEIADPDAIKSNDLSRHHLVNGDRVIFKTSNSKIWTKGQGFTEKFVALTPEAAMLMTKKSVALVGIDYLSIGCYEGNGNEVHKILLSAGIWVIEGLDLTGINPGEYDLACFPIKIENGDGAPARVALRRRV